MLTLNTRPKVFAPGSHCNREVPDLFVTFVPMRFFMPVVKSDNSSRCVMLDRITLTIRALIVLAIVALITPSLSLAKTLRWAPSKGKVAGYKIYWGQNRKKPTNSRKVGTRVAYKLDKLPLKEGVTYYISVSAYNSAGESRRSAPVVFKPGDNTPPSPPIGLKGKTKN